MKLAALLSLCNELTSTGLDKTLLNWFLAVELDMKPDGSPAGMLALSMNVEALPRKLRRRVKFVDFCND